MDKRTILAIILSMIVILVWQLMFAPERKEPPVVEEEARSVAKERRQDESAKEVTGYVEEDEKELKVRDVVVDTTLYRAVFTTDGGSLKSWTLKDYKDSVEKVVLLRRTEVKPPQPVELVMVGESEDRPLETEIGWNGSKEQEVVFDSDTYGLIVEGNREGSVVFIGRLKNGLEVVKRYRFYGDQYRVDLDLEIVNRGDEAVEPSVSLTWPGVVAQTGRYSFSGPSVLSGKSVARLKAKEIRKGRAFTEGIKWMAYEDNYFVSLIAPQGSGRPKVEVEQRETSEKTTLGFNNRMTFQEGAVGPGGKQRFSVLLYMGPKLPELLKNLDVEAEKAINFGKYLGSIEKVLLRILAFTHRLTGNYGTDIIILSILLKLIFLPLSRRSYKSMQEMQKVQPEMKMLQEKYKDDRQRLNQEMMALYKRRKINPVGGCLPMLVQFPFLIALYKALPLFFNLRHAPFILWLRDLSSADSFFVDQLPLPFLGNTPVGPLPLLMGVSMVIQQRMTPTDISITPRNRMYQVT